VGDEGDQVEGVDTDGSHTTAAAASTAPMVGGTHDLAPSTVTLSGVLNAIDGVSSQVSSDLNPCLRLLGRVYSHCFDVS
jgi:hypothetical protein